MATSLMQFRCSACGATHHIPRALAVACPIQACHAAVGERCRDLRSTTAVKYRLTPHREREALLP